MAAYKDEQRGTWYVSFHYYDWTGKNCRKVKRGFKTKREATEWERHFRMKEAADLDMTFEEFVQAYTRDMKPKLKHNTWLTKEHILRTKLLPYFKDKKMRDIRPKDIIQWQNEQISYRDEKGKPYAPTYLKTLQSELSALFNHAVRFYELKSNPVVKAGSLGKGKAEEMLFWTKEEYLKFIEAVKDKPYSYHAFQILYWCGLRVGELLALTPQDIDFDNKVIRVTKSYQRLEGKDVITDPKTPKSKRNVSMPDFLCEELKDYIGRLYGILPTDRIFHLTKSFLHHEMTRGAEKAGVKRIRIHDLRHPYVKHTTKIFSLRLMDFQAQAYPDARRKTRGACQLHQGGQSRIPVRPLCNRKRFSYLPPQSKMSWILYAISMRLSGYTSTRSINSSASSVVSVSASKIALDASLRLSCRTCSSCFCFACANTAA